MRSSPLLVRRRGGSADEDGRQGAQSASTGEDERQGARSTSVAERGEWGGKGQWGKGKKSENDEWVPQLVSWDKGEI
jgi:hypothetical protein